MLSEEALNISCEKSNKKIIELLVNKNCPMSAETLNIAFKNNIEFGKILLSANCPINKESIEYACRFDNPEIVKLLINKDKGKSLTGKILTWACQNSNLEIVELLLMYNCPLEPYTTFWAYERAKQKKKKAEEIIKLLERKGYVLYEYDILYACKQNKSIEKFVKLGEIPYNECLYWACKNNNIENVCTLLKMGNIKVNAECLYWACKYNNDILFDILVKENNEANEDCIREICKNNNLRMLKSVKVSTKISNQSLKYKINDVEFVKELVKYSELSDDILNYCENEEVAEILVNCDCPVVWNFKVIFKILNAKKIIGKDEFVEKACKQNSYNLVKVLINKGFRINENCIIEACKNKNIDLVKLLIKNKCLILQKSLDWILKNCSEEIKKEIEW